MEFWALGRQKHGYDVRRPGHRLGFRPGAVVQHSNLERLRNGRGEGVQPPLACTAVEGGQCEKAARPSDRFDRAIERDIVELVGHGGHRLNAAGSEPTTHDGQSAQPGFVLGQHLDRANRRAGLARLGEDGRQGGLELAHGCWAFFLSEGRGRCGLAWSLSRTRAWTLEYDKGT